MTFQYVHPDIGMNFQINRVLTYGERAARLDDVREIAARIHDFASWHGEWLALAQTAESEGRHLHAAYGYRMAEFFLNQDRPEKAARYEDFIRCFYQAIGTDGFERFRVPYEGTSLPAMRLQAEHEKAVVVVHGGYDSFIEEFLLSVTDLPGLGYTIILFEGPGQGQALKNGLTFTHEWEKPVGAILDFFGLNHVTLLGISWGGYLAVRAAAFEPRIKRVIAYDVCFDGLEVMTRPIPPPLQQIIRVLVKANAQQLGNGLIGWMQRKSLLLDWAVTHGMYITGTATPVDFYRHLALHTTRGISARVRQDVLLLAGEKDHYIPLKHLEHQKRALTHACSVATRLFTEQEGGEQHCQVGNHQLAIDEITRWMDSFVPNR